MPREPENEPEKKQNDEETTPFGHALAEYVETETTFSEQAGKMAKLLKFKLNEVPPLLDTDERELLEKTRGYYQKIAKNSSPWFGKDITPEKIKKMSFDEQKNLCIELYKNLQNKTGEAKKIDERIESSQWITVHYDDIFAIVNSKDKNGKPFLNDDQKKLFSDTKRTEKGVANDCLITPVQRLPRLILLVKELIKATKTDERDLQEALTGLLEKYKTSVEQVDNLINLSKDPELVLMSKLPKDRIPANGKMYLEKEGNKLKYIVLAPNNEVVQGTLDFNVSGELTLATLNSLKSGILKETSKKGHTLSKEYRAIIMNLPPNMLPYASDEKKIKALTEFSPDEFFYCTATTKDITSKIEKTPHIQGLKLIVNVIKHRDKIIDLFGEGTYERVKNQLKDSLESTIKKNLSSRGYQEESENNIDVIKSLEVFSKKTFDLFSAAAEVYPISPPEKQELAERKLAKNIKDMNVEKLFTFTQIYGKEIRATFGISAMNRVSDELSEKIDSYTKREIRGLSIEERKLLVSPSPLSILKSLTHTKCVELINNIHNDEKKITRIFGKDTYQDINKVCKVFELLTATDRTSILGKLKIEDLVKLTTDVHAHRDEIIFLFGNEKYKEIGKAFVAQYQSCIGEEKHSFGRWPFQSYTKQEKSDAANRLLDLINGKEDEKGNPIKLEKKDIKILEQGRLGEITKLFTQEIEKAKQDLPKAEAPTTLTIH